MINRTIEHYRVIARLGEGGMGEVWRAEDVRLGRQVALKILGGHLANDTVALRRFEDEARLAGSINHPHIISVYDVGAVDERPFIAMELVDGEPLDAVLASGRLRIDDVVTWALQIADALSAAHRAGILHRDVKPANIYVSGRGYAKLGDFGIAKLRERASDPALTVTSSLTGAAIVGSPSYLSPEQARAEPLDGRSDIFSFAATLYEMLTGRRAFAGPSPADVVAAVLREEPEPVSRLRPDVPPALEAIVTKGLEKRPEYRYQHMDEVVADLRRIKRDLEPGRIAAGAPAAPTSPDARRGTSASSLVAAFAAGALVAGGFTWWWAASRPDEDARLRSEYELARLTSNPGLEYEPAWSPDGRSVAYTSNEGGHLGIWIRQVPGERAVRVSAPDVDEGRPVWSPDGTQLAFVSSRNRGGRFGIFLGARPIEIYTAGQDGDLFVMPALGGTARQLAEDAYDPSWSPDGRRLAFRSIRDGAWRLYTVALDTGAITPVAGVAPRALAPSWSPDGRWIAYVGGASAATGWDLYVVRAGGGTPIQLTSDQTTIALSPSWSPDGRSITYSSNRAGPLNLWRVGFDAGRATATGPPARLTTGIGEDVDASVAPDGLRIAFASVHTAPNVWRIDVASRQLRQLTFETTIEDYPRLSPDGERLLFYSDRTGAEEVWMMQLGTGELTRISRRGGAQNAWSPDGRQVAYGTSGGLQIVNVSTSELRTVGEPLAVAYPAFSRDGTRVAFQGWDGREYRLYHVSLEDGRTQVIPTPPGEPGNPSWSPDGRTVYFQLDQYGRRNIWAVDLPSSQSRQLTEGDKDDAHPDVSADGRRLLFLRQHRAIYVMAADGTDGPALVADLSKDGRLVEWPAWGPRDETIVFSLAGMTGDLLLLNRQEIR